MRKYVYYCIIIALLASLLLGGCSSTKTSTTTPPAATTQTSSPSTPGTTSAPTTTVTSKPTTTATSASTTTATSKPTTTAASTPKKGGVLKLISQGGYVNFGNPGFLNSPADIRYASPAVETLLDADDKGNYLPKLALSYNISPDGTAITLKLRTGVKFHDGTDFNAEAVKYCIDVSRNGEWSELKAITSVDAVDPYTVKLNLAKFDWPIVASLATSPAAWIVSPKSLKENEKDWTLTHPVGTGPFKIASVVRDVSIKYERFDGYWQKGLPYLDGVEFKLMADATTALMAFKAGEGHQILANPKDVADLQKSGFVIVTTPGGVIEIDPSSANPDSPLSKLKVRQAIQHAIDSKTISEAIGYGLWEPGNQPFARWAAWAYNPNIVGYPYNPAKAKQLMAEAGYPNGFKTQLIVISGSPQDTYLAIQADLAEIGIDLQIEAVTMAKFSQMSANSWDGLLFVLTNYSLGVDPGQAIKRSFVTLGAKLRVSVQREMDVEELLIQSNAEPDLEKRKVIFANMTKKIVDEHCMSIFIYASQGANAVTKNVHDLGLGKTFWWTLEKTWLE